MKDGVYRRGGEPPASGPRLKILRVKARETFNVAIIGTAFHAFWTHWSGARTEPCTEPRENCDGCLRQWPQRWKCYLHAIREDCLSEGFLELTSLNRDRIRELLGGDKFLRGARVKVLRGNGDKTELKLMLLRCWAAEHEGEVLPDEMDPESTLRALFSFRRPSRDKEWGPK